MNRTYHYVLSLSLKYMRTKEQMEMQSYLTATYIEAIHSGFEQGVPNTAEFKTFKYFRTFLMSTDVRRRKIVIKGEQKLSVRRSISQQSP